MPNSDDKHQQNDQSAFEQALQSARDGNREAVGQMLELGRDYLLLIANQDVDVDMHRKMGASDLVQESMLNAQAHFDRFEGNTKQEFLAWLRGILKNDALHWRRHYKGVQKRNRESDPDAGRDDVRRVEPADAFYTPSTHAVAQEEEVRLSQAISLLPKNYQQVISLRSFQDKSFAEIGQQLSCSSDAARKLWARAILKLQEVIADQAQGSKSVSQTDRNESQP